MKKVEIGDFGSIWDAVSQTEAFDICYKETCVTAPGWGSPLMLILGVLEIIWWIAVIVFLSRWRKKSKRNKRKAALKKA